MLPKWSPWRNLTLPERSSPVQRQASRPVSVTGRLLRSLDAEGWASGGSARWKYLQKIARLEAFADMHVRLKSRLICSLTFRPRPLVPVYASMTWTATVWP